MRTKSPSAADRFFALTWISFLAFMLSAFIPVLVVPGLPYSEGEHTLFLRVMAYVTPCLLATTVVAGIAGVFTYLAKGQ